MDRQNEFILLVNFKSTHMMGLHTWIWMRMSLEYALLKGERGCGKEQLRARENNLMEEHTPCRYSPVMLVYSLMQGRIFMKCLPVFLPVILLAETLQISANFH